MMISTSKKNMNLEKIVYGKILPVLLPLLAFLLLASPIPHSRGQLFAVVVGVSKYTNWKNDLVYSHKDAIEMYDLLTYQTAQSNIKLLLNEEATCNNILYATRNLFSRAKPKDIVIFFFSGHGENDFFRAHDGKLTFKELARIFKQTNAKRRIIFADACYSGALSTLRYGEDKDSDIGKSVLLFLSSRPKQISNESLEMGSGAFTYYLIAGLRGGADTNKDRYITAKELFKFVHPRVKEYTNGEQVPVMRGRFDNNMIIFDWNKK